jgi:prepilin-type N-terminal cleavage/methylation domain-containing protein
MTSPVSVQARLSTRRKGVTLTELLCVIAIIAILAAFYLPAIIGAFVRVKKFVSQ